jgi:hypothetical protein
MQHYNILVGCDRKYHDDWAVPLFESIHKRNPYLSLHCHIVNPLDYRPLSYVNYTTENRNFPNRDVEISYLQCVRFLAVADNFSNDKPVITLDADSICTRKIDQTDFIELFKNQYVLQHHKENRWLAGFVVFKDDDFRNEYAKRLREVPVEKWIWGRDQKILNQMEQEFGFKPLPKSWMAIGKNKTRSAFLTLKGDQKYLKKYLNLYRYYL